MKIQKAWALTVKKTGNLKEFADGYMIGASSANEKYIRLHNEKDDCFNGSPVLILIGDDSIAEFTEIMKRRDARRLLETQAAVKERENGKD